MQIKDQFHKYIYEYRDSGTWNSQEETIKNLVSRFYDMYPNFNHLFFYVLNKEWFEPTGKPKYEPKVIDPRLLGPEWWCYSFFVLIVWFDSIENTWTVSEWYFD